MQGNDIAGEGCEVSSGEVGEQEEGQVHQGLSWADARQVKRYRG